MKKRFKILLSIISLALINIPLVLANTSNDFGKITINKNATKEDITYGRSANIELEVSGKGYNKINTIDIVLVLDRSSSMKQKPSTDSTETKIASTKKEAINLVNHFIPTDGSFANNIRIGIITFGTTVLDNYSTTTLSDNNTALVNLINSISTNYNDYGTNIHEGLVEADNLLKNSTADKKIVILLSDGAPNRFTYNNKVYGTSANEDVCYIGKGKNCTKSNPIKMTKIIATDIKKYATVYTIGFGISNNSDALQLLKNNIASTETNFYLAKDANKLQNDFKDIIQKINTIASNVIVTDTIPSTFELKDSSIIIPNNTSYETKTNDDNTTTITWNIGNLDITKNYKLKYNIIAKEPYYGNMYTNVKAILTGIATNDNPFYVNSNEISLEFEKPTVPIPAITVNDDYTNNSVYLNETLNIDNKNGLLKNDKLEKLADNDADLENNIQIKLNSLSCGNMSDVTINNDGSFTYKSNLNCLGKITFDYYIISNINNTEVISNNSKVTLNVIKKPTTYTVKYLDFETKEELEKGKKITDIYLYDEINEEAISISKYNLIGNKTITKNLTKENDEIIFYYVKKDNITYVVDYYYDNIIDPDKREIVINNKVDNTIHDYIDKKEYGYVLDYTENLPLIINEDIEKNTINIHYKRTTGNVIVKFVDNDGKEIKKSETISNLVNEYYKTTKANIDGYEFVKVIGDENGLIKEEGTTITYVYNFIIPKTGINDNYTKEIISISCLCGLIFLFIIKKLKKTN